MADEEELIELREEDRLEMLRVMLETKGIASGLVKRLESWSSPSPDGVTCPTLPRPGADDAVRETPDPADSLPGRVTRLERQMSTLGRQVSTIEHTVLTLVTRVEFEAAMTEMRLQADGVRAMDEKIERLLDMLRRYRL